MYLLALVLDLVIGPQLAHDQLSGEAGGARTLN